RGIPGHRSPRGPSWRPCAAHGVRGTGARGAGRVAPCRSPGVHAGPRAGGRESRRGRGELARAEFPRTKRPITKGQEPRSSPIPKNLTGVGPFRLVLGLGLWALDFGPWSLVLGPWALVLG